MSDAPKDPFDRLDSVAVAPVLLVASDYDGTLAPIVEDPLRAFPLRETMVALKSLASMPQTHVALISGRALRDLAMLTGSPASIHLVGSHGSEFEPGFADRLSPEMNRSLARLVRDLEELTAPVEGAVLERKPGAVAVHYRKVADEEVARDLVARIVAGPATGDGVHLRHGKRVVELSVVATHKGKALELLRRRTGASVAIYLGDDQTDEDVFHVLRGPDLSIKIGRGETLARTRLDDPYDVARFLALLAERRGHWLAGAQATPIERHSLLSDQRTVALVDDHGGISWFCVPRIDSAALFAELVGGSPAGSFAVTPAAGGRPLRQEYVGDTLILRTWWPGFQVTDYLDCSGDRPFQRAGRSDLIRVIEGRGSVRVRFAPRLDFGRTETRLQIREDGLEVADSPEPLELRSEGVAWSIEPEGSHQTASALLELGNRPVVLELRYGTGSLQPAGLPEPARREETARLWSSWVEGLVIPDVAADLVRRSALTLKALCHGPSGGIAAAATTSLPEGLGGVRNWDYRHTWLRDAALTAEALLELGSLAEAMRFLDWLMGVLERCAAPGLLRPVYTVTGDEMGLEAEIAELSGYAGSRPVRIGNSAARQLQLDVFGPLMKLVDRLIHRGGPISSQHWQVVLSAATAVAERWQEPDHGIWELRGPRRHFVHSKVMCWLTLDRAIAIGQALGREPREEWVQLRDRIAEQVLERGWKRSVRSFVAAYDGTDLDAAVLHVGLSGLLPADDERFRCTIQAVERYLLEDGTVYRYRYDDGLPGREGGFHLCTSWLIDSYILIGETTRARQLFDSLVATAGPTGLFAEEWDPDARRSLGNFPQAYTHLGLIRNALHLSGRLPLIRPPG